MRFLPSGTGLFLMKDLVETRYYYFLHTEAFYHVKTQKLLSSKKTLSLSRIRLCTISWAFWCLELKFSPFKLLKMNQPDSYILYSSTSRPCTLYECTIHVRLMSLRLILLWTQSGSLVLTSFASSISSPLSHLRVHLTCPYLQHIDTKSWYPVLKFHTAVKLIPTSSFWFAFNKT